MPYRFAVEDQAAAPSVSDVEVEDQAAASSVCDAEVKMNGGPVCPNLIGVLTIVAIDCLVCSAS